MPRYIQHICNWRIDTISGGAKLLGGAIVARKVAIVFALSGGFIKSVSEGRVRYRIAAIHSNSTTKEKSL
jgi:hypothetical protein